MKCEWCDFEIDAGCKALQGEVAESGWCTVCDSGVEIDDDDYVDDGIWGYE